MNTPLKKTVIDACDQYVQSGDKYTYVTEILQKAATHTQLSGSTVMRSGNNVTRTPTSTQKRANNVDRTPCGGGVSSYDRAAGGVGAELLQKIAMTNVHSLAPQGSTLTPASLLPNMQQFMHTQPLQAGIGLPQNGLDRPQDTSAAAMPGTPGHAATNVIDQRGGLDPRGLTLDGNNAAGVPKGFKVANLLEEDGVCRVCGAGCLDDGATICADCEDAAARTKEASVGGRVLEVLPHKNRYWVNTQDGAPGTECAIFVEKNATSDQIKKGDSLWWQGRDAFWTPAAVREGEAEGESDIAIPRIGYSGVSRPAQ